MAVEVVVMGILMKFCQKYRLVAVDIVVRFALRSGGRGTSFRVVFCLVMFDEISI